MCIIFSNPTRGNALSMFVVSVREMIYLVMQILGIQLEPLSVQLLAAINNLQLSSLNAEDALSQGMEALQYIVMKPINEILKKRLARCFSFLHLQN